MNFDRLDELRKKNGVSNSFLCDLVGRKRYYINDCKNKGTKVPSEYIEKWAKALGTSFEYLNGETDEPKQKTPPIDIDRERSEEMKEIMRLYDAAPPQVRKAAMALLESFVNGEDDQDRTDS